MQQLGCMQQLSQEQQALLAKNISAMLCARAGIAAGAGVGADPLLGNSRSSSPYARCLDGGAGTLDAHCMQLPAAALPLGDCGGCPPARAGPGPSPLGGAAARPAPAAPGAQQQQQQQQLAASAAYSCNDDSLCSHSSAHAGGDPALTATPPPLALLQQRASGEASGPCSSGSPAHQAASSRPGLPPPALQPAPREAAQQPLPQQPPRRPAPPGCAKAWLYELVTCPFLFKPCPQCCGGHAGREVLITYFDLDDPALGYCTYCPQRHGRPRLLQIRRSTYHEVVKAADVCRLTDVGGVQHYVINGAKVLFLRPRPQPRPPKGVVAPARCVVDGRQLMDAHSTYCSLRCKLEVEDPTFASHYPSAAEELEAAAAAAAAAGTDAPNAAAALAATGLAGTYHRQGGHEGRRVVVPAKRAAPAAPSPAREAAGSHDDASSGGEDDHAGEGGARHKRARHLPSKFANAVVGGSYQAAVGGGGGSGPRAAGHHHAAAAAHRGHGHGGPARDDTASDQAAGGGGSASGTPLSLAGLAGLDMLHKRPGGHAASPCGSEDSGRSSTCNQRCLHKRKVLQPCRAPMQ